MNLTLHLTENCNMDCDYCPNEKTAKHMDQDIVNAACKLIFSHGNSAFLCFFGGEPMLERPLIEYAVKCCEENSHETGIPVQYRMTTNGTLLTEEFIEFALKSNIRIDLSFDGTVQDICRKFKDKTGTFACVEKKAEMLLRAMPASYAMMTIAPKAVSFFSESVRYLHGLGFEYITATLAYGNKVSWDNTSFKILREQMTEIAEFYEEQFLLNKPFFFSPFDAKIRDLISGSVPSERCHLGLRQMSVATDGRLYACNQFIGEEDYCLGDVFNGVDIERCCKLAARSAIPESCKDCALRTRCLNSCGCTNRLETGDEKKVSPLQCAYERMLIEITDELGDRLFEADEKSFRRRYIQNLNTKK